jgi:hypothetical protein
VLVRICDRVAEKFPKFAPYAAVVDALFHDLVELAAAVASVFGLKPPNAGNAAKVAIALVVALFLAGCAGSFEESRGSVLRAGAPELSAQCVSLDSQHRTWGGVAKGSAVVAGGLGALEAIPGESKGAHIGLGAGALAAGAVAATAVFVSEDAASSYVAQGCGK